MNRGKTGEGTLGFSLFETRLGHCGIAWGEHGLTGVQLPEGSESLTRDRMLATFPGVPEIEPPDEVRIAVARIVALLNGEPDDLCSIPLDMSRVPPFHRRVYELVRGIAPGHTMTYGEVAALLGQPGAARAVGQALGHNPFAPVVPCHRILAAGSRPGGFSARGGAVTKLRMLRTEGVEVGGTPGLFDDPSGGAPGLPGDRSVN
jgi:methylated-DNA-[protein]-cysteine S-methyltransferase